MEFAGDPVPPLTRNPSGVHGYGGREHVVTVGLTPLQAQTQEQTVDECQGGRRDNGLPEGVGLVPAVNQIQQGEAGANDEYGWQQQARGTSTGRLS